METQNWVSIKQHKQQKITDLETNKLHRSELHTHTQEAPRRHEKGKGGKKHEINKKEHRHAETTLGEKIALFLHKSSLVQKKTCHPNASLSFSLPIFVCVILSLSLTDWWINWIRRMRDKEDSGHPQKKEGADGWVGDRRHDLIWSDLSRTNSFFPG